MSLKIPKPCCEEMAQLFAFEDMQVVHDALEIWFGGGNDGCLKLVYCPFCGVKVNVSELKEE